MSKVVASLFLSLDGVAEAPERWHFPFVDEAMGAAIGQRMADAGAFLLGRRTYEEWAAYWPGQPTQENPMAAVINDLPKYVASTTLRQADLTWQNSTLLGADVAAEVSRLKQKPGKEIAICGSATLVRSLLAAGVVDELRLMVHPLVLGAGGRLFENGIGRMPLELVSSGAFATGVLDLTYQPSIAAEDRP